MSVSEKKYDVVAVGNALLDISGNVSDKFLAARSLRKGSMDLVSPETAMELASKLRSPHYSSGGSAANTAVGVASFGGTSAFIGNVASDEWGTAFTQDLLSLGVDFLPAGDATSENQSTGCCLVLVTPDGERTMMANLGASTTFKPASQQQHFANSAIVLSEGYVCDSAALLHMTQEAAVSVRQAGGLFAFSLSDVGCVERHQDRLRSLLPDVDILFANELEIQALYNCSFSEASEKVSKDVPLAFLTRGAQGSLVVVEGQVTQVAAQKVAAVDTTGAGDQYAAGVLYGLNQGMSPVGSAELGAMAASEVVSHQGARPKIKLSELV